MLTKQGNTQVYSPFGSYVVEQHRPDCERPERCVPEPQTTEQPQDQFGLEGVAESGVARARQLLQLGHQRPRGAVDLGDHAQRLGVELDADQADAGDRGLRLHAVGLLLEIGNRRLDALRALAANGLRSITALSAIDFCR